MAKQQLKKQYVLYDGRACAGTGTSEASVLVACSNMREAKSYRGQFGQMACYSYDVKGTRLINEKHEWNYPKEK